ncbi:MAG TPA: hypothetical protein VGL48_11780 [Acidimicrobiales bacterium]
MATQKDARRIALAMPETREDEGDFRFAVRNGSKWKGFAWAWNERVESKKPRVPNPGVLVVRVANQADKEGLLASDPTKFFTEPHYNGFPAALVRLEAVGVDELEQLLTEAWMCQAPRRLVEEFEQRRKD